MRGPGTLPNANPASVAAKLLQVNDPVRWFTVRSFLAKLAGVAVATRLRHRSQE